MMQCAQILKPPGISFSFFLFLTGEPGIKGLAGDWLNGNLYWTNHKTESIYMQAADGKSYTTVLSKNIKPSDLVLVPVERYAPVRLLHEI